MQPLPRKSASKDIIRHKRAVSHDYSSQYNTNRNKSYSKSGEIKLRRHKRGISLSDVGNSIINSNENFTPSNKGHSKGIYKLDSFDDHVSHYSEMKSRDRNRLLKEDAPRYSIGVPETSSVKLKVEETKGKDSNYNDAMLINGRKSLGYYQKFFK